MVSKLTKNPLNYSDPLHLVKLVMAYQGSGSEIIIYIRTAKETKQLTIHENAAIKELKYEIAKQLNISPEENNLIFAGKYLKDREKLKEKNIRNGYTVFLMPKPVIQQQDETPSTSQQVRVSRGGLLESYLDFPDAFDSTANYYSLSQNRQAFLNYHDEISTHFSTVLSTIFNPELLRNFNLQSINITLLRHIFAAMPEIVREPRTNSESLNTDVLGSYLNVDSLNLISIPEILTGLVMIAETPVLHQDARIIAMLVVYLGSLQLQNYPVGNFRRMFEAFLVSQLILQVLDTTIADVNTNSTQDSTASIVESQYHSQLEELESMGFLSKEENLQALTARSGNIRFAIDRLLKTSQDSNETDSSY